MKLYLLLIMAVCLFAGPAGAAISAAEYYFNTDPGPGNALPLTVVSGDLVSVQQTIPAASLAPGLHRLFVRVRDLDGVWSGAEMRYLYRFAAAAAVDTVRLTEADARFDNGAAFPIDVTDGALTGWVDNLPVSSIAAGLHVVNVRYRSSQGVWGSEGSSFVFKFPAADSLQPEISESELWFDNGPHTVMDITDGLLINLNTNLPVGLLGPGLHVLNVRYRPAGGLWGPAGSTFVYRFPQADSNEPDLTQAEAWFDNQPRTALAVVPGQLVNLSAALPVSALGSGLHTLNLRYRTAGGQWGPAGSQFVYRFPGAASGNDQITQAEIRLDNGDPLLYDVPDNRLVSLTAVLPTGSLAFGQHQLEIRYRDNSGRWSEPQRSPLFVIPGSSAAQPSYFAGAEYFINHDPGEGNGFALPAADGAWNSATETIQCNLGAIPPGHHWIGLRLRDNLGHWSTAIRDTFWVGPLLTIRSAAPDIILDWTASISGAEFFVYRASTVNGPFALLDSTFGTSYTDAGVLNTDARRYYFITHGPAAVISDYRWPPVETPWKR